MTIPRPKLEVHHGQRVEGNPATFPATRANRIRKGIATRMDGTYEPLTRQEKNIMSVENKKRRIDIIRLWVTQKLGQEIEEGPAQLEEIDLDAISSKTHILIH